MVDDDEDTSKDKEIDKLMALISLSFKKIYKPTNNNLRTSSNTSHANQDNSPRIHRNAGYKSQRSGNVAGARETVEQKVQNDDQYDVFAIECQHPEQSESVHKTYLIEQDTHNEIIESEDMNYDSEQIDQNDEDADLAEERCYNDNLALMLSLKSDEVIHLEKESRSKLSDLIRPFDYAKLNSLYDLFVPQREKSSEQRFFQKDQE
nr:hypothetical protein [Tanacetum cinerariifolium]